MTRVVALIPDLLFGSQVSGALKAAGHEVDLVGTGGQAEVPLASADVLVVDLTDPNLDGAVLVEGLRAAGALRSVRVLGFYAHVDPAARERALAAGFDLVVPRSRMAREGAGLVERLAGGSPA